MKSSFRRRGLRRAKRLMGLFMALGLVTGCAIAPVQEMSDARQAVESARSAGAQKHAPEQLKSAEDYLLEAEQELNAGDYGDARRNAQAAKDAAISARQKAIQDSGAAPESP